MKLKIEITMDNAAFAEGCNGDEAARILRRLAGEIQNLVLEPNPLLTHLRDINGNKVGKASVTH